MWLRKFAGGPVVVILVGSCATSARHGHVDLDGRELGPATLVTFDEAEPGRLPINWSIRQTNPTRALATWEVVADPTAPSKPHVLALTKSQNHDGTFNVAVGDDASYCDIDLSVRIKAVSGEEDQGGGPIWRCKDADNYYVCRFNPLEANFRVYKVVGSRRTQLDSASIATEANKWYEVRVTMIGDRMICYLNGEKMLEATDSTFGGAGMVGLWTKADAVTRFDNLTVREVQ